MADWTSATTWNGGVCGTCAARYIGHHVCSHQDITRRINELRDMLSRTPPMSTDRTSGCPCRPEKGGSGVCGCVLSGPSTTGSTI